jgi:hypothetical protein
MAIDKITTASITDANITTAKLAYQAIPFRNIIINGDMSLAQRGTSFTGLGNGDSAYTLDRFKWAEEGSMTNEWTVSQSTDVPTGQGFAKSFKVDCTTADTSIDSGNIQYVGTAIEGQNLQYLKYGTSSAESMVLSFWVKSNKTGTYTIALINTDTSEKLYSQAYTISSANTWEKKTLTYTGDTAQGFINDNGNSLLIQFNLVAGSDKQSGSLQTWGSNTQANRAVGQVNLADSTSNDWYITGLQLEAGTTASEFEFLPHDVNENRCLRYCFVVGNTPTNGERNRYANVGTYYTATQFFSGVYYPVVMRATPSFTAVGSNTAQAFTIYSANAGKTSTAVGRDAISTTNIGYVITTASAGQGDGGLGAWNVGYYGIIEAEL